MFDLLWQFIGVNTSHMTDYQLSQLEVAVMYGALFFACVLTVVSFKLLFKVISRIVSFK